MTGEPVITVVGNLTEDVDLRFSPSGQPVANFTVASTPRTFDRDSNQYKDGETLFLRCSIWRDAAENMVESLHKGDRVMVVGTLISRTYDTKDGSKKTVMEMKAEEVGASLRYAQAKPQRVAKSERQPSGGDTSTGWGTPSASTGGWGTPAQTSSGWGAPPADDAPPF